jgi:hypothetical protein
MVGPFMSANPPVLHLIYESPVSCSASVCPMLAEPFLVADPVVGDNASEDGEAPIHLQPFLYRGSGPENRFQP